MSSPYLLGLYEKSMPNNIDFRQKLNCAKEAGYDFLELSIDETDEKLARLKWTPLEKHSVIRDMLDCDFAVRSICLSGHRRFPLGHPDRAIREKGLDIMAGAIDLDSDLGIRIIQIAGYDVYYEPGNEQTRKLFGENLQKSVELASKAGVILAFETMETEFLNTVEKAMYWVNLIGSPYLQVYPDSGNITNAAVRYETDVINDLRTGRGHLAALHLKESLPGVFREVPYGTGHVDFSTMTKAAFSLGVRRYLAEFWYNRHSNWEKELTDNCQYLRTFVDNSERV